MTRGQTNGIPWPTGTIDDAISAIETGTSPKTLDRPVIGNERGVLKVSAVTWHEFRAHESKALPPDFDTTGIPTVRKGDLLLSRANTAELLASPVLVQDDHPTLILSDKTLRLVPRPTVDPRFLLYALRQPEARHFFLSNATGTSGSMRNVSQDTIRRCPIPLPPLSEQKRIADILDKADAIRRKRQEAVAIVESGLLRSTFREQLGNPRTNPKGWPIEQLGTVITFVGGSQPPKETFINEPRPGYVRLVQIRDFKTDKYPTYIPKELARRPFAKDDVMIARYGPPVFQILRGLEGSYNVALMKAENTERTTRTFIFYLLQIPEIHDVVVANSQRTAGQSGTNLTLLKGLEMPIPPIEKQIEISAILKSIETYHATAQSYCNAADDLFNCLVQRAFKGEL